MDRELTREELDDLLPLYAIGALDGEEREQVARYVARDATARAEVDSLREAATLLPSLPEPAPASLWAGIEDALSTASAAPAERPMAPVVTMPAVRAPHTASAPVARRTKWLAVAAAVVLLVAISVSALLGVVVAHQQDRIDALADEMHDETLTRQAAMARSMPGAHAAALTAVSGASVGDVVMLPDGTGWFVHADLGALPDDRTYQLWAMVDDGSGPPRYVSVGVLGSNPADTAFRANAPVSGFVVSEEPAGGAASPGVMVAQGSMA